MRHSEHAHLLSNIEKLPLPILGSMFPFWNPTGVFLQSVAHAEKDRPSLFVASLQSTSFVVSPAEGEGAPGSSGPVHSGRTCSPTIEHREAHFPFGAVCSLSGAQPEIWSVGWNPPVVGPVHRIAFRLFVAASLQSTSFVVSPAEGKGAPGSSGPVHSGRSGPTFKS